MKLVIDISNEDYEFIKDLRSVIISSRGCGKTIQFINAIKNGTPLPKGHGRLIDADEIRFENADFDKYGDYCVAFDAIENAPTIIEADKGEEE